MAVLWTIEDSCTVRKGKRDAGIEHLMRRGILGEPIEHELWYEYGQCLEFFTECGVCIKVLKATGELLIKIYGSIATWRYNWTESGREMWSPRGRRGVRFGAARRQRGGRGSKIHTFSTGSLSHLISFLYLSESTRSLIYGPFPPNISSSMSLRSKIYNINHFRSTPCSSSLLSTESLIYRP